MTTRLLVDNGSSRPESTRSLRGLSMALTERLGAAVHPVSLLHADRVPPETLDGRSADILAPFLGRALRSGERDFLILPFFFGPSAAIRRALAEIAEALTREHGPFRLRVARELCPLPEGEPRLADILADQVALTASREGIAQRRVVLVDHGSPAPPVSAVRNWLAGELKRRLGKEARLEEAAMERRPGSEYDFSGELLERVLMRLGRSDPETPAILSMLFLAPGRHAGPQGDIVGICRRVTDRIEGFRVFPSPLVGTHPGLVEILARRAREITDRGSADGQASR